MAKLFAFWNYSTGSYTSVRGGTVSQVREDGCVETVEYGKDQFFKPFVIMPKEAGLVYMERLNALEEEFDQRLKKLKYEFSSEVRNIAPFTCVNNAIREAADKEEKS